MGIDKGSENIRRLDRRREGDRVFIKPEKLESYVGMVKVPQKEIDEWNKEREAANSRGEGDAFLDNNPHPKAVLVSSQFFIIRVGKLGRRYEIAPLMDSSGSFWVHIDDVQDGPPPASIQR